MSDAPPDIPPGAAPGMQAQSVPSQYEVREFNGQLRYAGPDESLARTIYDKYAALGTPVELRAVQVAAQSEAFVEQHRRLIGTVPWARQG